MYEFIISKKCHSFSNLREGEGTKTDTDMLMKSLNDQCVVLVYSNVCVQNEVYKCQYSY